MPLMRGIFSRRVRNPVHEAPATANAPTRANMLGLTQVCAQVAEGLLAAGGRDATQPVAADLERMCLANFNPIVLQALIESGVIFDVLTIADHVLHSSHEDREEHTRDFESVAALVRNDKVMPTLSVQQDLVKMMRLNQELVAEWKKRLADGRATTKVPKLPATWKKFYCPQASYSVVDLCGLFENTNRPCYDNAHTRDVLNELLTHLFLGQEHAAEHRMALCEAVLSVMANNNLQSLEFDGRSYSKLFFVTLAADMALAQLKPNSASGFRSTVVSRLERLLLVSGEETTQFTLRGEPCTRRDIVFWVRNIRDTPHWVLPEGEATAALAQGLEQAMKVRSSQSVHSLAVLTTGNKVYDLMLRQVEKLSTLSSQEVRSQIELLLLGRSNASVIRAGLNRVINDQEVSTSIGIPTTPSRVLTVLWQYIQHHDRPDIRESLKEALLIRFHEIGGEKPCHVGRLERLLDVPSGIDERLNVFARQKQLREEVQTLAGQVNELNLNAMQKVEEFQRRSIVQFVNAQGLDLSELQPEMNLMIPGFVDDSDDEVDVNTPSAKKVWVEQDKGKGKGAEGASTSGTGRVSHNGKVIVGADSMRKEYARKVASVDACWSSMEKQLRLTGDSDESIQWCKEYYYHIFYPKKLDINPSRNQT